MKLWQVYNYETTVTYIVKNAENEEEAENKVMKAHPKNIRNDLSSWELFEDEDVEEV